MSSPQSATPNAGFQSRLNRVAERRAPHEAAHPQIDVLPDWKENARGPAGIAAAVLTGILAVVIVRIARFHVMGVALVSESPDITLAVETGAALLLSFLIFLFLPWKGIQYRFLQFGGVALMALTMHNMVHSSPGLFRLAFSSDWTDRVLAQTEPGSMYVRGHSIPFAGKVNGDDEDDATELATAETETAPAEEAAASAEPVAAAAPEAAAPELPRRIQMGKTSFGN
ncbi:hypothetical protein [Silicimonas sp. MF1-12-2]|uniref:hypothetical protein n=1 Tax=Silicimonas sp. MF1-12-2 TaxID=3384793 RepID=UPI0039B43173